MSIEVGSAAPPFTLQASGGRTVSLADMSGKPVAYVNMSEDEYRGALEGIGLPGPLADLLANSSAKAAGGALFNEGHALSTLIGHPTTPMIETVKQAVAG